MDRRTVSALEKKSVPEVRKDSRTYSIYRMTGGVHLHTLRCPDEASFHRMEAALEKAGILYKKE